jgi:RNA repair pathway DNA polymerase beta family
MVDAVESLRLALAGMILRVPVGSTLHGLHLESQDDRDELAVAVEPPEHVLGFGVAPRSVLSTLVEPPDDQPARGELGEKLIRLRLLVEGLAEQVDRRTQVELIRERTGRAV